MRALAPAALGAIALLLAVGLGACKDDSSPAQPTERTEAAQTGPAPAGNAGRPNVFVILTDDMTLADLYETYGENGEGDPLMPRTRELIGDQGVTFDRYYSSNSISCPSRYTYLTGEYSKNNGVTRNNWGDGKTILDSDYCSTDERVDFTRALPIWMQRAGYRTMHFGRFLNAFGIDDKTRIPEGWDFYVQPVETSVSSTAAYYGYRLNINGKLTGSYGDEKTNAPDEKNYFTDVMTDMALDQIENGDRSKPFYVSLDHRAPHEDHPPPVGPQPALRHIGALGDKGPRMTPNYNEADVSDKTKWLRQSRPLNSHQEDVIALRNRRRLEALIAVDEDVEKIVDRLDELGELDNTYIIFTSDNGFFNGEHRISKGKFRPYENSSHVPFMIRGPGIPAGDVSEELAANVDLAPTIMQIGGAKANRPIDGRSMLPFARHPQRLTQRPILLEAYPPKKSPDAPRRADGTPGGDPTPPAWRGIVYGRWKLVRFKDQGYELYDLLDDPYEILSVANDSPYRGVFEFLRGQLERLERCKGASCRHEITAPPPPAP